MKREKNTFYCFLAMIAFMVCYLVTFILSSKTIAIGRLTALAGATIYPITYFISILFYERYGKKNTLLMITYTVFALILATLLILIATSLPIYNDTNVFNLSFNSMVASIAGFVVGQSLNIYIYNYLEEKSGFSFLISAVISITIDSLIFVVLGSIGVYSFDYIVRLFTGQYIISIVLVLFYALCFAYLTPSMIKMIKRIHNEEKEVIKEDAKKETKAPAKKTVKKAATKAATTKKATTTRKATTKNTTTKKQTKKSE